MNKKKKIIIAIVAVVLTIATVVGIYFIVHNKKEVETVSNTPETTIDSWVEDYDFHNDEDTSLQGYEDRELPSITLQQ